MSGSRTRLGGLLVAGSMVVWVIAGPAAAEESAEASAPAKATFAGGCFWFMQPPFDKLDGVLSTSVGYTGGRTKDPTYPEVSAGGTGHAEAVQVVYDPAKISYAQLLDVFWHNIDPLTPNAQFCDQGSQYRSAIFYHDATQRDLTLKSKRRLEESKRFERPIVTEILAAMKFYPAEEYHQNYPEKNPARYKYYRWSCGRDRRLKELWGMAAASEDTEK